MAKALGIKNTDHIAVPISSLYGEHIITSTEALLGIGSLNSTRPLFNLTVYATSASDFQMPNVPVEMLNSICADYDHLTNITFPQIGDKKNWSFNRSGCLHSNSTTKIHNRTTKNPIRSLDTAWMDRYRTNTTEIQANQ